MTYPLLLDGGLSNELERMGFQLNNPLWTAGLIASHPEAIIEAHQSYLESGARCVITSSYQASFEAFKKLGIGSAEATEFLLKSVDLAKEAIQRHRHKSGSEDAVWVAASIGPYGAFLGHGEEYEGHYALSDKELKAFHRTKIEILDQSEADILACETIPSRREALVLSEVLRACKKPSWISFSCRDGIHISDGTPIREIMPELSNNPQIFALGVNCTAPQHITSLLREIKASISQKRIVIYPNSGKTYDANDKSWIATDATDFCTNHVEEWLKEGADMIGGCCTVGPREILKIGKILAKYCD